MRSVLVLVGANFMGHITNVLPITDILQKSGYHVEFKIIPLTKIQNPPIVNFLKILDVKFEYIDKFASSRVPYNVFSYLDLLYMCDFNNPEKVKAYCKYIRDTITDGSYDLVISDFTLYAAPVCRELNIMFIAIRSHALKTGLFNGKTVELFNWWDEMPLITREMISTIENLAVKEYGFKSIDELLYGGITITPGFAPFDERYPVYGEHYFVLRKESNNVILPQKDVYIYVRDRLKQKSIINLLIELKLSYFVIDSNLNSNFVDLWDAKPNSHLLISHGGHGMCVWSAVKNLFHLIIPDNNDRISNARRIKSMGCGEFVRSMGHLKKFLETYKYTEKYFLPTINYFNSDTLTFEDFSKYIINKI